MPIERDSITDETRRVRENEAAKHGFDVKAILLASKKRQRRSGHKVASLVRKKKSLARSTRFRRIRKFPGDVSPTAAKLPQKAHPAASTPTQFHALRTTRLRSAATPPREIETKLVQSGACGVRP